PGALAQRRAPRGVSGRGLGGPHRAGDPIHRGGERTRAALLRPYLLRLAARAVPRPGTGPGPLCRPARSLPGSDLPADVARDRPALLEAAGRGAAGALRRDLRHGPGDRSVASLARRARAATGHAAVVR